MGVGGAEVDEEGGEISSNLKNDELYISHSLEGCEMAAIMRAPVIVYQVSELPFSESVSEKSKGIWILAYCVKGSIIPLRRVVPYEKL